MALERMRDRRPGNEPAGWEKEFRRGAPVVDVGPGPARAAPTAGKDILSLQRLIGNSQVCSLLRAAPSIRRFRQVKVGGFKVKVADNKAEAEQACKTYTERQTIDTWNDDEQAMEERSASWKDDISLAAKEHVISVAQTAKDDLDVPQGIKEAENLIDVEIKGIQGKEDRKERKAKVTDDYADLVRRLRSDEILEASAKWMRDSYIAGEKGKVNHTLGVDFTRDEIAVAVNLWKGVGNRFKSAIITNLHGYAVGPKDPAVGDTLDRRGDQGNIIALWSGTKINIHINPSD
jgi:hypothetical protein